MRSAWRRYGSRPGAQAVRENVLAPMSEVSVRIREHLSRLQNANTLAPLDHDPVPENYSELVRKYYEKLGGGP